MMERISALLCNRRLVAGLVMLVVLVTLGLDIAGLVHPCPYCRVQRAALGVIALILLVAPRPPLFARFLAALAGVFGLVVGVSQNFNHIKKMNAGEFDWAAFSIGHPWLLSGLAVISLVWLLFLVFEVDRAAQAR
jgi:disulfide bond formation protein DsbB